MQITAPPWSHPAVNVVVSCAPQTVHPHICRCAPHTESSWSLQRSNLQTRRGRTPRCHLRPTERRGLIIEIRSKYALQTCFETFAQSYPFTKWSSASALGLLVAFGQRSVTGAQPFTGSIIDLHGDALSGPFLGVGFNMGHFPIAKKVFKPVEQLRKFSKQDFF